MELLGQGKEGHRSRLRARFLSGGLSALAEYEILELLLTFAIPRKDVKPIAKALLIKFGSFKSVLNASEKELMEVEGVGESSRCLIKFMRELIPLFHLQVLEEERLELDSIDKLIAFFRARMDGEKKEVLELACFDSDLRLLPNGAIRLFEGSANMANVDIRKILEIALNLGATSIVISHNHPNGDMRPSFEDINFTRKLSLACKSIRLSFIEHIIIAKNAEFSFRRDGRFDDLYDETLPDIDSQEESFGEVDFDESPSQVAVRRKRLKM